MSVFAPYARMAGMRKLLRGFRPKVTVKSHRGSFTVKTADDEAELEQVLRLRHQVFHEELLGRTLPLRLDLDAYDRYADHLCVIDDRSGRIAGTYRLLASSFAPSFYSQSEFDMSSLLLLPGEKLELSRACIHPDFRDGLTIHLLWRGLMQYVREIRAETLFGCASVHTMDRGEVALIYQYLSAQGLVAETHHVSPLPSYRVESLDAEIERWQLLSRHTSLETAKALLPPLFSGYLRAGARVYGQPALDRDFKCVDFLTVLKLKEMTRLFERKYAAC